MAKTKTMDAKKVTFSINAPNAKDVRLAGDFNKWNASKTSLTKTKGSEWQKELSLMPGKYQYKFVVDGNWIADPTNSSKMSNAYGSENSVIEVKA